MREERKHLWYSILFPELLSRHEIKHQPRQRNTPVSSPKSCQILEVQRYDMCMLAHEIEKWGRERELYALATTDISELPIRPIPLLRQPSAPMVCATK